MAKGVRKTYEERLTDIDKKIEKLIADKNRIIDEHEQGRKDELLKILNKSGMSANELRELIENNKKAD